MALRMSGSGFLKTLFILSLVIYFLFLLLARVPATWAAWAVQENVPGVWLTGVSGTLWDGRAKGGTLVVGEQKLPVENLRWQVHPWRLLGLRGCADITAEVMGQPASGTVCGAPGNRVTAENVQLSAPMAIVSKWLGVRLAGPVSMQLREVRAQGERIQALSGNISWRDARWHDGEQWANLGAFAADLSANDQGGIGARIFDLDGPFSLDLIGNFVLHQEPVVQGTIAATDSAPQQLRELLQLLGQPQDDGRYRVAWPPGT
jgi:general secretion pathway protein N